MKLTRHHRQPKSRGGAGRGKNISLVPEHKHRAFHLLFHNHEPPTIAQILNDIWIDPEYILIAVRRNHES